MGLERLTLNFGYPAVAEVDVFESLDLIKGDANKFIVSFISGIPEGERSRIVLRYYDRFEHKMKEEHYLSIAQIKQICMSQKEIEVSYK